MSQVMRSIARQWRDQEIRERAALAEEQRGTADCEPHPEKGYVASDLTARMRKTIADDPEAFAIFESILRDQDKAEAQEKLGCDDTTWDTARRRMVRRLFNAFEMDWKS